MTKSICVLLLIISSSVLVGMEAGVEERPRTWSSLGKRLDELLGVWSEKEQKEREELCKKQQEREATKKKEFNEAVRAAHEKREKWVRNERKKHAHAKMKIIESFTITDAAIKKGCSGEIGLAPLEEQEGVQHRLRRTSSAIFPKRKWAERIQQIQNESRWRSIIHTSEESSGEEASEPMKISTTSDKKLIRTKSLFSLLK